MRVRRPGCETLSVLSSTCKTFFFPQTKTAKIDTLFQHRLTKLTKLSRIPREDEGRERIPHTWASSDENYLKSIFGSLSYCVVILRTTPHWTVRMTSCNFRLLTWKQQIKITFSAWVRTNNEFQVISMGQGDLCS